MKRAIEICPNEDRLELSPPSMMKKEMTTSANAITGTIATLLFTIGLLACDTGATEPEDVVFPDSDVSYARHVQPLFDLSCSFSGCHNSIDRADGLSLASYIDLFSRSGLVRPGDSAASLLVQVISSRQPHTYPIREIITADQARGVAVWVEEGARNN